MKAADTNVVIRFLGREDVIQTPAADAVFGSSVYLSRTVLLETEWVLRSALKWNRSQVNRALTTLLALGTVRVDDLAGLVWALERHAAGADFADMLHLTAVGGCDRFTTFDREVGRHAGRDSPVAVELIG